MPSLHHQMVCWMDKVHHSNTVSTEDLWVMAKDISDAGMGNRNWQEIDVTSLYCTCFVYMYSYVRMYRIAINIGRS